MKTLLFFLILIFFGCSNSKSKELNKTENTTHLLDCNNQYSDTLIIYCDSIYKSARYKLTLISDPSSNEDETLKNSIFRFEKVVNGKEIEVFSESLFSSAKDVKFEDFNNDKVRDILIQNISDVRSNWTYYLYLVDVKANKLKKVIGFQEIKNPRYNQNSISLKTMLILVKTGMNFMELKVILYLIMASQFMMK